MKRKGSWKKLNSWTMSGNIKINHVFERRGIMDNKMREITSSNQLNSDAVYYSEEYKRIGNNHFHWTTLYNAKFEPIENVHVRYTNVLSGLRRIVRAEDKDDLSLLAYDLRKINDDFYAVERNEYTSDAIKAIADSVKPAN